MLSELKSSVIDFGAFLRRRAGMVFASSSSALSRRSSSSSALAAEFSTHGIKQGRGACSGGISNPCPITTVGIPALRAAYSATGEASTSTAVGLMSSNRAYQRSSTDRTWSTLSKPKRSSISAWLRGPDTSAATFGAIRGSLMQLKSAGARNRCAETSSAIAKITFHCASRKAIAIGSNLERCPRLPPCSHTMRTDLVTTY